MFFSLDWLAGQGDEYLASIDLLDRDTQLLLIMANQRGLGSNTHKDQGMDCKRGAFSNVLLAASETEKERLG